MRHVSDKIFRGNQNTHFMFNNIFFFDNRAVYEFMWKITAEPECSQMAIRCMRTACWIPRTTHTHSEYLTL